MPPLPEEALDEPARPDAPAPSQAASTSATASGAWRTRALCYVSSTMDEPRRPAPTLPMVSAPRRTRRGLIIAVGAPAFVLGVILAAHRPLLGVLVRHRAAALGFDLDFDALAPSLDEVRLTHARVGLTGVRGVHVTATSARLTRRGLSLAAVDADGVVVSIEGTPGERVLDVASWSGEHQDTYRLRGAAHDVRLEWRARADTPAWLTMSGGTFTTDGTTARFVATSTSAFGVPTGPVGASFAVDAAGVTIEAGKRDGGDAPVVATLKTAAHPPTLSVTLRPVELSALGTALGLALPGDDGNRALLHNAGHAVASGHADLTLGRAPAGVSGTAALELDGWTPPHPKTLDGIVFGNKTAVSSHLRLSEDRATVKLDNLEVRAGRLDLKGGGTIIEEGNHALVHLEVAGPIPCSELARSMAKDELGGLFGGLAGDLAGRAVGGSATVTVAIDADSRDLGAAKVKPRVGLGCELKLPGL